jgi:hypothetical protein
VALSNVDKHRLLHLWLRVQLYILNGDFFGFLLYMYIIQHCIFGLSDYTVSEDAGTEPRTAATLADALTTRLDLIQKIRPL